MTRYARVAVPRPLYRTFLYRVPDGLSGDIQPGSRVVVPFGRLQLTGWVDQLLPEPDAKPSQLRDILDVPDAMPVLDPDLLALCRWVSSYYVAPLGLAFRVALPASLTAEATRSLRRRAGPSATPAGTAERALLACLDRHKGPVKLSKIRKSLGPGPWTRVAQNLAERGLVEIAAAAPDIEPPVRQRQVLSLSRALPSIQARDRLFVRSPRQRELFEYLESVDGQAEVAHLTDRLGISRSVVHGLVSKGIAKLETVASTPDLFAGLPAPPERPKLEPTRAQRSAIERILDASGRERPGVTVLKGVTGSGKTLVYIEVLRELVSRRGHGAIVLVPEISLTPQTLARFRGAFGDDVALLHSALSEGERYSAWRAVRAGEKRIVIGARSAVFAPVRNLGAIVIDEEHEGSYKQNDPAPRYHAREVAVVRARGAGAVCVLGSATPSLETWLNATEGRWELLELPERIGARPLPAVRVIDLRETPKQAYGSTGGVEYLPRVLSDPLTEAVRLRLGRREQTIMLLNRRGYSSFIQCRACGSVIHCHRCNVSLTLHRRPHRLVCHHCNHQEPVPERCGHCGSPELSDRGIGTEQVERVLGELFPDARVARMDVDTTSGKWSHHTILRRVERRQVDILIGTQMIAKGLDFPGVTLVGVVNADVGLHLPDFRASERTFQLLTQVAGRAGRGPAGGEVIVQSALPEHYVVRFALDHDFTGFATRELAERAGPRYPPHVRLANLLFSGTHETSVQQTAERALDWLNGLLHAQRLSGVDALGPAPCPIDRIRGRWRWHLLLKTQSGGMLGRVLRYFVTRFQPPLRDVRVEIDRDPLSLL